MCLKHQYAWDYIDDRSTSDDNGYVDDHKANNKCKIWAMSISISILIWCSHNSQDRPMDILVDMERNDWSWNLNSILYAILERHVGKCACDKLFMPFNWIGNSIGWMLPLISFALSQDTTNHLVYYRSGEIIHSNSRHWLNNNSRIFINTYGVLCIQWTTEVREYSTTLTFMVNLVNKKGVVDSSNARTTYIYLY